MLFTTVINKAKKNSVLYYGTLVLIVFIFCLRFIGLDKDLPPYGVGAYNAPDEGLYGFMGLNMYNYDSINPVIRVTDEISVTSYTSYHLKNNVLMNLMVYAGLKLFGDNYYGFRSPIVLIALINLLLIMHISSFLVKKYGKDWERDRWLVAIVSFLFTCSFPFLVSSRVVEPTILRMSFGLLAYDFFLRCKKIVAKYFAAAFLVATSVQLVYLTNVFFFIPIIVCGCMYLVKNDVLSFRKSLYGALGGGAASLAVGAVYYKLVWNTNFFSNALNTFHDFSTVGGYQSAASGGIKVAVASVLDFWGSNVFLFYLPVLVAFLVSLPAILIRAYKMNDDAMTFSVMAVLGLFLQTLATNDYIFRKAVLILPFVVFSLIIHYLENGSSILSRAKLFSLEGLYRMAICLLLLLITYYRFFTKRVGTAGDYSLMLKGLIIICVVALLIVLFESCICENCKTIRCVMKGIMVFAVLINVGCGVKYVYFNDNYTEKDAMISLREYDDQVVFGAYSYGYSLYNDMKPVLLMNDDYKGLYYSLMNQFRLIDVANTGKEIDEYFDNFLFDKTYYFVSPLRTLNRSFTIDGKQGDFAVYSLELKENIESGKISNDMQEKQLYVDAACEVYKINERYKKNISSGCVSASEALIQRNNDINNVIEKYGVENDVSNQLRYGVKADDIQTVSGVTSIVIYGNIYGDINANVGCPIYGDVYGDIHGDVNALIYGNIYGRVYGDVNVEMDAEIYDNN